MFAEHEPESLYFPSGTDQIQTDLNSTNELILTFEKCKGVQPACKSPKEIEQFFKSKTFRFPMVYS